MGGFNGLIPHSDVETNTNGFISLATVSALLQGILACYVWAFQSWQGGLPSPLLGTDAPPPSPPLSRNSDFPALFPGPIGLVQAEELA